MRKMVSLAAIAALATASAATAGDILWDNDIVSDGFNARAVSPPVFPNIRVADDFKVPAGGWSITDFHATVVEDAGWVPGDTMTVYFYEDRGGQPGAEIATRTGEFMREFTGEQLFDRDEYNYWIDFESVEVGEGRYWVGFENGDASGDGTNYWTTSTGNGDPDTGWFSLDDGASWAPEGDGWHHAFQLTGVPAPGALAMLALGGVFATRRRRR